MGNWQWFDDINFREFILVSGSIFLKSFNNFGDVVDAVKKFLGSGCTIAW
jgi:hypothetical protein